MQQHLDTVDVEATPDLEVPSDPSVKRYKGTLLYTRTGFKVSGWLYLSEGSLRFEDRDGFRRSMPLKGLRARSSPRPRSMNEADHGPKDGSYQFGWRPSGGFGWYYVGHLAWWQTGMGFYHRVRPRSCFHTTDTSIVNDPAWAAYPRTQATVQKAKPWFPWTRRNLWRLLVLATLLFVFVPQVRAPVVDQGARYIPITFDQRIGEKSYRRMRDAGQLVLIEAPQVTKPFGQLIEPLLKSLPHEARRFDLRIEISTDAQINAFAIPGGHIVIYRGLLLKARTPEEAAGVVAHEMAHVVKRHTIKQVLSNVSAMIAIDLIFPDEEGPDAWFAEDVSTLLAVMKFSRDNEREADELGCAYLEAARIDPQGLLHFFENLEEDRAGESESEGEAGSEALEIFENALSTHPSHEDRIEYLRERTQASPMRGAAYPADVNWKAFKEALEAVPDP